MEKQNRSQHWQQGSSTRFHMFGGSREFSNGTRFHMFGSRVVGFRGSAMRRLLGCLGSVVGSPFPPAHRGHPILPLLVSFTSLRRSSLRVVAIMAAADGRDGPGEDSVPRAIGRNHRNLS